MEENSQVNDQSTDSNAESSTNVETPTKKDTVAYDSYRKVVGKSKKLEGENDDLRSRLDKIEQDKLSANGQKDEVIKSLRDQLAQSELDKKNDKQKNVWNTFSSNIKTEAAKRGCKDPEKLLKLLDKDDLGAVEVDDNYNVNSDDLNRLMDKAIKENDFLFGKPSVNVKDITPSDKPETGKAVDNMSIEEKLLALAKLDM